MDTEMMYQKLKQIFPHHIENINFGQISLDTLNEISSMGKNSRSKADHFFIKNLANLPQLPLQQIHQLCRSQEKNVRLYFILGHVKSHGNKTNGFI